MTTSFGTYVHTILDQGRQEAREDGSAMVEAQHLLLAIAAGPDSTARQVLSAAGLDHDAIRAALDRSSSTALPRPGYLLPASTFLGRPGPLTGQRTWGLRPGSRSNEASAPGLGGRTCSRRICCSGFCRPSSAPCRVRSLWPASSGWASPIAHGRH